MELSQRLDLGQLDIGVDEPQEASADTFSQLAELIERVAGIEVERGTRLDDAGIGSLDRIELAVRIEEQFGALIDENVYHDHPTVDELAEHLEAAQ